MKKERSYSFNDKYVKVSKQTILWSVSTHNERNLIFFLRLKRNYQNGYIESPETRFKEFGQELSKSTYLRRVNALVSMGWAINTDKGIQLIGIDSLPVLEVVEHDNYYYFGNNSSLSYVYLRFMVNVISQRAQECKVKISKLHPEKSLMLLKSKGGELKKTLHEHQRDVSMSVTTLAQRLNRSRSTALRQLSKIRKLGIINTCSRYVLDDKAIRNYKVIEGKKFRRIANQFDTVFDFKVKDSVSFISLDKADRIAYNYCGDCF